MGGLGRLGHRLGDLFRRYETAQRGAGGPARRLSGADGRWLGYAEEILREEGRLVVTGWARDTARVALSVDGAEVLAAPTMRRDDVAAELGCDPVIGFRVSVPCAAMPQALPQLRLIGAEGTDLATVTLRLQPPPLARLRIGLRLMRQLIKLSPAIAAWKLGGDLRARDKVRDQLGLSGRDALPLLQAAQLTPPPEVARTGAAAGPVTILLPVYNAFDLLPEVLDRVLRHTELDWHLIAIEDASPDDRVRPFLRDWAAGQGARVTLLENSENRGFIGSVNRGFAALSAGGAVPDHGPVVLLNSDAFLPQGWAARLVAPLADPEIATVTPLSNDAEIFSVPAICARSDLAPGQADALDQAARGLSGQAEAPTGVGFCMAMSRDWLARIGDLDPAFGRGYGEEVDWCQRARAEGGRHVGISNLFVEHRGGESFGSAEKQALIAANGRVISSRYPNYDREVQEFIAADPLICARLALALDLAAIRAGSGAPRIPVYLAHSLGGGAEHYLRDRIRGDLDRVGAAAVLRIGGKSRWVVECHSPSGVTRAGSDDAALVGALLARLPHRQMVYSCGVGDSDPAGLPDALLAMIRPDDQVEMLFHDWYPLSPSYTLTGSDGRWQEPLDPADPVHQAPRPDGSRVALADWQAAWRRLAERADALVVFSPDGQERLAALWPDLTGTIVTRPHQVAPLPVLSAPASGADQQPVIAVLGAISAHKGAEILQELARQAGRNGPRIVMIGQPDPRFAMPRHVTIHGPYQRDDIADLARQYGVSHWLIPSVWPETFSFTTHEALSTGLPVIGFDLGAQGQALRAAPNGISVPFGTGAAGLLAALTTKKDKT